MASGTTAGRAALRDTHFASLRTSQVERGWEATCPLSGCSGTRSSRQSSAQCKLEVIRHLETHQLREMAGHRLAKLGLAACRRCRKLIQLSAQFKAHACRTTPKCTGLPAAEVKWSSVKVALRRTTIDQLEELERQGFVRLLGSTAEQLVVSGGGCARMCERVHGCARVGVRACMRVRAWVCARACVCTHVWVCAHADTRCTTGHQQHPEQRAPGAQLGAVVPPCRLTLGRGGVEQPRRQVVRGRGHGQPQQQGQVRARAGAHARGGSSG